MNTRPLLPQFSSTGTANQDLDGDFSINGLHRRAGRGIRCDSLAPEGLSILNHLHSLRCGFNRRFFSTSIRIAAIIVRSCVLVATAIVSFHLSDAIGAGNRLYDQITLTPSLRWTGMKLSSSFSNRRTITRGGAPTIANSYSVIAGSEFKQVQLIGTEAEAGL